MRSVRLSVEPSLDAATYPFHHRIRVRFAETDAMGIVHHSRYLPYLEEARVEYLRHLGHPYSEMRSAGLDYAVETDTYRGGMIFVSERVGAFFYVEPETEPSVRELMRTNRFRPAGE